MKTAFVSFFAMAAAAMAKPLTTSTPTELEVPCTTSTDGFKVAYTSSPPAIATAAELEVPCTTSTDGLKVAYTSSPPAIATPAELEVPCTTSTTQGFKVAATGVPGTGKQPAASNHTTLSTLCEEIHAYTASINFTMDAMSADANNDEVLHTIAELTPKLESITNALHDAVTCAIEDNFIDVDAAAVVPKVEAMLNELAYTVKCLVTRIGLVDALCDVLKPMFLVLSSLLELISSLVKVKLSDVIRTSLGNVSETLHSMFKWI